MNGLKPSKRINEVHGKLEGKVGIPIELLVMIAVKADRHADTHIGQPTVLMLDPMPERSGHDGQDGIVHRCAIDGSGRLPQPRQRELPDAVAAR